MGRKAEVELAQIKTVLYEMTLKDRKAPSNSEAKKRLQEDLRAQGSSDTVAAAVREVTERWDEYKADEDAEKPDLPPELEAFVNVGARLMAQTIEKERAEGHRNADARVEARQRETDVVIAGLHLELNDARERSDEVATRAAELEAARAEDAETISRLEAQLAERDDQLSEARARLDQERAAFADERAASEQDRRELEHQITKLIERPEEVRAELTAKLERVERQREDAEERAHAEREQERREQGELRQMLDREMSELRDERAAAARLREERATALDETARLREELAKARADLAAAAAEDEAKPEKKGKKT